MATHPRSKLTQPTRLTVVDPSRKVKQRKGTSLKGRLVSTGVALALLVVVLLYFPPGSRNAQANVTVPAAKAAPDDLRFSEVQISHAPDSGALFLDGMVTNAGNGTVTAVAADVEFRDEQGQVITTVQQPLVGMAHGGTELVASEFARNPIAPHEMRFFRIALEQAPAGWNHELPQLRVVSVKTP